MRVVLVGLGSVGDVAPLLTLGRTLSARGHQVRLVALGEYAGLAAEAGLELVPVPGNTTSAFWPDAPVLRRAALAQPGVMFATMATTLARTAPATNTALITASAGCDLIVPGLATRGAGAVLADRLGVPCVPVLFAPLLPSADPAATSLAVDPLAAGGPPGHLRRVASRLTSTGMWRMTGGLAWGHTRDMMRRCATSTAPDIASGPFVLATSPVVCPPADDRAADIVQTGWIPAGASRPAPDADLERFLAEDDPPVLMSFGSCPVVDPRADLRLFRRAARAVGRRLVVQSPAVAPGRVDRDTYCVGSVDHRQLVPRMAAVVHHGGAGTTLATLASGRPAVVVPHLGDQAYYARRVHELGAGPAPVPRWRLGVRQLTDRVEQALESRYATAAAELADRLALEDGATRTATVLEEFTRGTWPG